MSGGVVDAAGAFSNRGSETGEIPLGDAAFSFRGDDVHRVVAAVKGPVVAIERFLRVVAVRDDDVAAVDGFGVRLLRGGDRRGGASRGVVVGVDPLREFVFGFEEPADVIRRQRLTPTFDRGHRFGVEFTAALVCWAVDPVL